MKAFIINIISMTQSLSDRTAHGLQNKSKRNFVIKEDHLNKTLQRMEAGETQTDKLPLPEWTPPAAAHTVAYHFSALSASPTYHSSQPTSCFIFMGTSTLQFKRKDKGQWLRGAAPPAHFYLSQILALRRCPILSALWAQCSVSCALVCLVSALGDARRTDAMACLCFRIRRGTAR